MVAIDLKILCCNLIKDESSMNNFIVTKTICTGRAAQMTNRRSLQLSSVQAGRHKAEDFPSKSVSLASFPHPLKLRRGAAAVLSAMRALDCFALNGKTCQICLKLKDTDKIGGQHGTDRQCWSNFFG